MNTKDTATIHGRSSFNGSREKSKASIPLMQMTRIHYAILVTIPATHYYVHYKCTLAFARSLARAQSYISCVCVREHYVVSCVLNCLQCTWKIRLWWLLHNKTSTHSHNCWWFADFLKDFLPNNSVMMKHQLHIIISDFLFSFFFYIIQMNGFKDEKQNIRTIKTLDTNSFMNWKKYVWTPKFHFD